MLKFIKRLLFFIGLLFSIWFILFAFSQASSLAQLAGRLYPAAESWVFYGLVAVIVLSFLTFFMMYFIRPKVQILPDNPTEDEIQIFRQDLSKRLKSNTYIKGAGIDIDSEEGVNAAINLLNDLANKIIKDSAKKIFLTTAVSQNGNADSIVTLANSARTVWNISKLYNQRPRPRELYKLYLNVATSALISSGLEDLDVTEGLTAIPGLGAIPIFFTSSILNGAANAHLTLRIGVMARNYMSLNIDPNITMRRKALPEAAKMLIEITRETGATIVNKLSKATARIVGEKTKKAVTAMGCAAKKSGELVSDGVKTAGNAVGSGAKAASKAVISGAKNTGSAVGSGASHISSGVSAAGNVVADKAIKIGRVISKTTTSAAKLSKK